MSEVEIENAATIEGNTAADAPVTDAAVEKKPEAKGRKTKNVKEVKEKKTVAAAPKKRTVSSHPTYEEVKMRFDFVYSCFLLSRILILEFRN